MGRAPHGASDQSVSCSLQDRAMPQEERTADRLANYSDAVLAVITTVMVLELRAPDQPAFSALLAAVAHSHQLCRELSVHRHHLDKPSLLDAVRRPSDTPIDVDQLRPFVYGVAVAVCDGMGCAPRARVIACLVLRGFVRVRGRCLQHVRARSISRSRRDARARAYAAHRAAAHFLSSRFSRPLCSWSSSRRALASA